MVSSLAAGMQQAVGEDVAALGIGGELDLVDRQEADAAVDRHRLDRADEVGGWAGMMRSSPVIRATAAAPFSLTMRS